MAATMSTLSLMSTPPAAVAVQIAARTLLMEKVRSLVEVAMAPPETKDG